MSDVLPVSQWIAPSGSADKVVKRVYIDRDPATGNYTVFVDAVPSPARQAAFRPDGAGGYVLKPGAPTAGSLNIVKIAETVLVHEP